MSLLFAPLPPLHLREQRQLLDPLADDDGHLFDAVTAADGTSPSSSGEIFCGDAPPLAPNASAPVAFVAPRRWPRRHRHDALRCA